MSATSEKLKKQNYMDGAYEKIIFLADKDKHVVQLKTLPYL